MSPFGIGKKGADLPPEEDDAYLKILEQRKLVTGDELAELKAAQGKAPETDFDPDDLARGKELARLTLLEQLQQDPEVREAMKAAARTLANLGISALDVLPAGLGEVGSWGSDIARVVRPYIQQRTGHDIDLLTPDVRGNVHYAALAVEAAEFVTAGMAPTHAAETAVQGFHDIPRIIRGIRRGVELAKSKRHSRKLTDQEQEAIDVFLNG